METNAEEDILHINGISLYYQVYGQGEPLLLMHGGNGSSENFRAMLPELMKHFQVITPDSRAHGRSTDSDKPLSYRQLVDDMVGLLDALRIDSVYAGGWSDGAGTGLHMAIYHPNRVSALILTPVDLSAEALSDIFWEDAKARNWNIPNKLATWWSTRTSPSEEELSRIEVPTLIIAGQDEQYIKHDYFKRWHQVIPNSELVWIPEASHFLVYEKPDEVNQAILSFLNNLQVMEAE
jgi:pimeloyl-ACP methyl ester carboxylesterase